MVRFGEILRTYSRPRWRYIQYNVLKNILKSMKTKSSLPKDSASRKKCSSRFVRALKSEIKAVDAFFAAKKDALHVECTSSKNFSRTSDALHRYAVLNYLAVLKIVKKHDKRVGPFQHLQKKNDVVRTLFTTTFYKAIQRYEPLVSPTAGSQNVITPMSGRSCPICLEEKVCVVTLPLCGHSFCWSCLSRCAAENHGSCPICRKTQSLRPSEIAIKDILGCLAEHYFPVNVEIQDANEASMRPRPPSPPSVDRSRRCGGTAEDLTSNDTSPLQFKSTFVSRVWTLVRFRSRVWYAGRMWRVIAVILPILICLMLSLVDNLQSSMFSTPDEVNRVSLSRIPKCEAGKGVREECVTVLFAPRDVDWVDDLMTDIANESELGFGTDIRGISDDDSLKDDSTLSGFCQPQMSESPFDEGLLWSNMTACDVAEFAECMSDASNSTESALDVLSCACLPCDLIADKIKMERHFLSHPNNTQLGVLFTTAYFPPPIGSRGRTPPDLYGHILYFNRTDAYSVVRGRRDPSLLELKRSLDAHILKRRIERNQTASMFNSASDYDVSWSAYPVKTNAKDVGAGRASVQQGAVWLYVGPAFVFSMILAQVAREREKGLRLAIQLTGVRAHEYFTSWWFVAVMASALATFVVMTVGAFVFRFKTFVMVSPSLLSVSILLLGVGMSTIALILSNLSTRVTQAIGPGVVVLGIAMCAMTSVLNGMLMKLFDDDNPSLPVLLLGLILCAHPAMPFARLWLAFASMVDPINGVTSSRFEWSTLNSVHTTFGLPGHALVTLQIAQCIIGGVLVMYVDYIRTGGNGGDTRDRRPWFEPFLCMIESGRRVLNNKSQCCKRARCVCNEYAHLSKRIRGEDGYAVIHPQSSVEEEKDAHIVDDDVESGNTRLALHVSNLVKSFPTRPSGSRGLWCRRCSTRSFRAVKNLSLDLPHGQTVAILGSNGAGKSTTINCLIGSIRSTSGCISVNGHDITRLTVAERAKLISVCPQFDVLWPSLSPREHLRLFLRLRGANPDSAAGLRTVDDLLHATGLTNVADRAASKMSGGMQRRLSLAIAFVGRPTLVILDEPTSGCDPIIRRETWKMLRLLRRDAAVILTTHIVDEAEALAGRVVYMSHGKIVADGSPSYLKHQFGGGYVVVASTNDTERLLGEITRKCPVATEVLPRNDSRRIRVQVDVKNGGEIQLRRLVLHLRDLAKRTKAGESRICDVFEWGVSYATLSDVFRNVVPVRNTRDEEQHVRTVRNEDSRHHTRLLETDQVEIPRKKRASSLAAEEISSDTYHSPSFCQQYVALLQKRFWLQRSEPMSFVCQVLIPIFSCAFVVALHYASVAGLDKSMHPFQKLHEIPSNPIYPALPIVIDYDSKVLGKDGDMMNCMTKVLVHPGKDDDALHARSKQMMSYLPTSSCSPKLHGRGYDLPSEIFTNATLNYTTSTFVDIDEKWTSSYDVGLRGAHDYLSDRLVDLTEGRSKDESMVSSAMWAFPTGALVFDRLDESRSHKASSMSVAILTNDLEVLQYHLPNGLDPLDNGYFPKELRDADINANVYRSNWIARSSLMQGVYEAYVHYIGLGSERLESDQILGYSLTDSQRDRISRVFSSRVLSVMPEPVALAPDGVFDFFATFMYPFVLTISLPMMVAPMVRERDLCLYRMQRIMSVRHGPSVASDLTSSLLLYVVVASVLWIGSAVTRSSLWSVTSPMLLVLILLPWGIILASTSIFLSISFRSATSATIWSFVVAIVGTLFAVMICDMMYGRAMFVGIEWQPDFDLPTWLLIYPQCGMIRAIYLASYSCVFLNRCMEWDDFVNPDTSISTEFRRCILALLTHSAITFMASIALRMYAPDGLGTGISRLIRYYRARRGDKDNLRVVDGACKSRRLQQRLDASDNIVVVNSSSEKQLNDKLKCESKCAFDEDDSADFVSSSILECERERQECLKVSPDATTLVVRDLSKKYKHAPVYSVRSLSVKVKRGHCLGLLGSNGAGKSTTIKCITGEIGASDGSVWISGRRVVGTKTTTKSSVDTSRLPIGICPQHSCLWPTLTPEQHVQYILRVSRTNMTSAQRKEETSRLLTRLGLQAVSCRRVQHLSGGQQRRLSVAMAIAVPAELMILDEPGTGLDMHSRHDLWDVILEARREGSRAILLTTHDMSEAEALCSRCAIMSTGTLRCIGTPQYLKNTYAAGYNIHVRFSPSTAICQISAAMKRAFPRSKRTSQTAGSACFSLPLNSQGADTVFSQMHQFMNCPRLLNSPDDEISRHRPVRIEEWSAGQFGMEDVFCNVHDALSQ